MKMVVAFLARGESMYTGKSGSLFTIPLSLISRMKYSSSWVRPTAKEGITTLPPLAMVSSMIFARSSV